MNKLFIKIICILVLNNCVCCFSQNIDIIGPTGSGSFGEATILSNGNFVVTDPLYDENGIQDIGAVYLYNGNTKALISSIKGSSSNDRIGIGGITPLNNGNFVILSPYWSNGNLSYAGAITLVNGISGLSGMVSSTNSLVGSSVNDNVGKSDEIYSMNNGNFIVNSKSWDNGSIVNAGAVTFVNGTVGITGSITSSNSLIGSSMNDELGNGGILILKNGCYLVCSPHWDNNSVLNAGAVTWGNSSTGISGTISISNSLIGTQQNDQIGNGPKIELSNGNFVISSITFNSGLIPSVGAVTWGNGSLGLSGTITLNNSLVGQRYNDRLGSGGIIALKNGNFVISSPNWKNDTIQAASAVTFGNGMTGVIGNVSPLNSLIGSNFDDRIGSAGIIGLENSNYVVSSPYWDRDTILNVGAVTWGSGSSGVSGFVSTNNSLIGSKPYDRVGIDGARALTNGNYVVISPEWSNDNKNSVGAITWGNGLTGSKGEVSLINSLVGSTAGDRAGDYGVIPLTNGNYVVSSQSWQYNNKTNIGAVTWGNGVTGISGSISSSNSLIGSSTFDNVGKDGIVALKNGNYVVSSSQWNNGTNVTVGAVTLCSGVSGIVGNVSAINSLIGEKSYDGVGANGIVELTNGNFLICSYGWNNNAISSAGALTFVDANKGLPKSVSIQNSLVGSSGGDRIGLEKPIPLQNGNYYIVNKFWNKNNLGDAGSVCLGNGISGLTGAVNSCHSVLGEAQNNEIKATFNNIYNYVIVQQPKINKLTISNKFSYRADVKITSNDADNQICAGILVKFTAQPTNGGIAPIYQWRVNNKSVGTNSSNFETISLVNSDSVYVIMNSSDTCALGSPVISERIIHQVTSINKSLTLSNGKLLSNQAGAIYQWLDCDKKFSMIQGSSMQSYTPTIPGKYAVQIKLGSCIDTSNCLNTENSSIENNNIKLSISYPNPFNDYLQIILGSNPDFNQVKVSNINGKQIYSSSILNKELFYINTSTWPSGIYILSVYGNSKIESHKLVKY